jgi:hypothetical protein
MGEFMRPTTPEATTQQDPDILKLYQKRDTFSNKRYGTHSVSPVGNHTKMSDIEGLRQMLQINQSPVRVRTIYRYPLKESKEKRITSPERKKPKLKISQTALYSTNKSRR